MGNSKRVQWRCYSCVRQIYPLSIFTQAHSYSALGLAVYPQGRKAPIASPLAVDMRTMLTLDMLCRFLSYLTKLGAHCMVFSTFTGCGMPKET